jgi:hypothetical protein
VIGATKKFRGLNGFYVVLGWIKNG